MACLVTNHPWIKLWLCQDLGFCVCVFILLPCLCESGGVAADCTPVISPWSWLYSHAGSFRHWCVVLLLVSPSTQSSTSRLEFGIIVTVLLVVNTPIVNMSPWSPVQPLCVLLPLVQTEQISWWLCELGFIHSTLSVTLCIFSAFSYLSVTFLSWTAVEGFFLVASC